MLGKLLILVRNRKGTAVLIAVFLALLIAALIVGVSDSIPGIVLGYMAAIVLVFALTRTWQEVKKFLVLLGASFVAFLLFLFLHNVFYGLGEMTSDIAVLRYLMQFLHILLFCLVVFVCPVFFVAGAVGSVGLFIKILKGGE